MPSRFREGAMDPLTVITAALVSGATAALKSNAEQALKDAYAGIKALIKKKWGQVDVDVIERDPASRSRKDALKEELEVSAAAQDGELLAKAIGLLETVRKHDPAAISAGGLSIEQVSALRDVIIHNKTQSASHIHQNQAAGDVYNHYHFYDRRQREQAQPQAIEQSPLQPYMVSKMDAYKEVLQAPEKKLAKEEGNLNISTLRVRLLNEGLEHPMRIKVAGTLFPSALLTSGWWDNETQKAGRNINWNSRLQAWLFHGFDVWGPSWDFTFDLQNWSQGKERPYFIAQLGHGDEADSIPLLVPRRKAERIMEHIDARKDWPGFQAEVSGTLLHRTHIEDEEPGAELELFGGLLDFFIRLDDDNKNDWIAPQNESTGIYSGYLWKCVIPRSAIRPDRQLLVEDAFFLWEHTNFASAESVAYNIDSLYAKERYIEKMKGDLVLVQKSSVLVPGEPQWTSQEVYRALIARTKKKL